MAEYKYAFQNFNKELMARAVGRDLRVSSKQAIEICNYLRHRKLQQAKNILQRVLEQKQAIPFRKYTNGLGHRRGKMASGRYPMKASEAFLKLLESVEANAQTKGLNTGELEIIHFCTHRATKPMHQGRHGGREMKSSHIEVVVKESKSEKRSEKTDNKEKGQHKEKVAEKQEAAK